MSIKDGLINNVFPFSLAVASLFAYQPPEQASGPRTDPVTVTQPIASIDSSFTQPLEKPPTPVALDPSCAKVPANAYHYCYEDKYASIVVNAVTGDVVYGYNMDEKRSPASMIKMLTLYELLEAKKKNDFDWSMRLAVDNVTDYRTKRKICVLNTKSDDSISIRKSAEAMMILSAANTAGFLAKYIHGTDSAYAKASNETALRLGMMNTHVTNPSGAPDVKQYSTAADIAKLGQAVFSNPEALSLMSMKSFTYKGVPIKGHALTSYLTDNHAVAGKTGYIQESGFNTCLLLYNGKDDPYIVVVMGGKSAKLRNLHAIQLYKEALAMAEKQSSPEENKVTYKGDLASLLSTKQETRTQDGGSTTTSDDYIANKNILNLLTTTGFAYLPVFSRKPELAQ